MSPAERLVQQRGGRWTWISAAGTFCDSAGVIKPEWTCFELNLYEVFIKFWASDASKCLLFDIANLRSACANFKTKAVNAKTMQCPNFHISGTKWASPGTQDTMVQLNVQDVAEHVWSVNRSLEIPDVDIIVFCCTIISRPPCGVSR